MFPVDTSKIDLNEVGNLRQFLGDKLSVLT
jgi:hypothetical protein